MSKKVITARRLGWTSIAIAILLALLFVPGIRKRSVHQPGTTTPSGESAAAHRGDNLGLPATTPFNGYAGTAILFRVLDARTGQPIENAALLVGPFPAVREMSVADAPRTDSNGQCSISVPGPPTNVIVRAATYVSRRLSFSTPEDYSTEYTFKLEKGSFIGGFVRDETGSSIADVKLAIASTNTVLQSAPRPSDRESLDVMVYTRSDKSGRWVSDEVLPNPEAVSITLDHPYYGTARFTTQPVGSTPSFGSQIMQPLQSVSLGELKEGEAVLVMKSSFAVAGIVMDGAGNGIAGSEIREFEKNPPGAVVREPVASAKTDRNGRFLFRSLRAGEVIIAVQAKGFAPQHRTIDIVPRAPEHVFRLARGETIRGRVIDDDGKPVEGALIRTITAGADQPISWEDKTDAGGTFYWDSAPVELLRYNVSAQGFNPVDSVSLDISRENEIRLSRGVEVRVSAKVIDAKTRLPIESFKVTPLMPGSYPGWSGKSVAGKNGEFTLTASVTRAWNGYSLLVEADGYISDNSHKIDDKESFQPMEIALMPGGGYTGIVTLPDGSPAPGATVILCGGNLVMSNMPIVPRMSGIRTIHCSNAIPDMYSAAAVTDGSGKFSLKSVVQAHSVYATHEKGIAAVTTDKVTSTTKMVLQAWGRVEGKLMIGSKPGANQRISLSTIQLSVRPPALNVGLSAVTDKDGKFEYPTVPPGEYRVSYSAAPMSGPAQIAFVVVRSGETAFVQIGGNGRPVIGRIIATTTGSNVPLVIRYASLSLKSAGEQIPPPADAAAYRDWVEREDVRSQLRSEQTISVQCAEDGSFRAEDVSAGTYVLSVGVALMDPASGHLQPTTRLTKEILIPEIPGGRSEIALDLGTIMLQLVGKK
jgi:protocatechuate 3,4-dioxygenase beta subunit